MANITKINRGKGVTYRIRVGNGYDTEGKQKSKSMSWTPPEGMTEKQIQKELNKKAVEFENKVKDGLVFENIKFADFSKIWVRDYVEKQCSPKYIVESKRMLKTVNKHIGHIPLAKLKKAHLQSFYNSLSEEVKVCQRTVNDDFGNNTIETVEKRKSPSTILHYHRLISTILTKATQWDYVGNNICLGKGLELPKQIKYQPKYLQDSDVVRLVACLEYAPVEYRVIILLMLYTGMRNGEVMGLEWSDIDFENNLISINRTSQYIEKIGVFTKETKNNASERVLQVVPEVTQLLKQYRSWQNEQKLKLGPFWKANPENTDEKHCDNWNICKKNGSSIYCKELCSEYKDIDRLFTQFNGVPMHPKTPYQWLKKFMKKNNLPDINIHSLRHTNISLMIMQGVPLTAVAKLAGHSSIATTAKVYSHSIKTAEQLAMEKVANVINPSRKAE